MTDIKLSGPKDKYPRPEEAAEAYLKQIGQTVTYKGGSRFVVEVPESGQKFDFNRNDLLAWAWRMAWDAA